MDNEIVNKYIADSKYYNNLVDEAHDQLHNIINGRFNNIGLVDDKVRNSEEFKKAKSHYNKMFAQLRDFNSSVPKSIKQQAYKIRLKNKAATQATEGN